MVKYGLFPLDLDRNKRHPSMVLVVKDEEDFQEILKKWKRRQIKITKEVKDSIAIEGGNVESKPTNVIIVEADREHPIYIEQTLTEKAIKTAGVNVETGRWEVREVSDAENTRIVKLV